MQLSQVLSAEKKLVIAVDDQTLNLTYLPGAYTPEFEDRFLTTMLDEKRGGFGLAKFICGLVTKWDLMDGDQLVPLKEDVLNKLPSPFLRLVGDAITEDINPEKKKQSTLKDGYLARE